ncbi:MAG: sulfur carrier protein ThiS [Candidatus Eremiobacteraeota bacterium]|nr:sulfur carrier protein ThiS [Candidatus Eremiobacteraeota bacterium]
MKVSVNGQVREIPEGSTVASLLAQLEAPGPGIAVARNDAVVRRAMFGSEPLDEGDRIEIIKAVAGG